VIEDYASKMPFKFTGTLKKLTIVLEPVPADTRAELEQFERQSAFRSAMRD